MQSSSPIGLVPAPFLASPFAVSFHVMPLHLGVHTVDTWFFSDRAISFSIQSATSNDIVTLALSAVIAT